MASDQEAAFRGKVQVESGGPTPCPLSFFKNPSISASVFGLVFVPSSSLKTIGFSGRVRGVRRIVFPKMENSKVESGEVGRGMLGGILRLGARSYIFAKEPEFTSQKSPQ